MMQTCSPGLRSCDPCAAGPARNATLSGYVKTTKARKKKKSKRRNKQTPNFWGELYSWRSSVQPCCCVGLCGVCGGVVFSGVLCCVVVGNCRVCVCVFLEEYSVFL